MNEFLEQFVLESRELVEQATGDLLAMAESPEDKARLDSAFRAFHTLKGAAGIVDFDVMGRVLHAAESILAAARAGDHPVTADLVDDCLACLDVVIAWLDVIEATGDLPVVTDETTTALVARFEKASTPPAPSITERSAPDWLDTLLADHPAVRSHARVALRYAPDPGCFFRGDDPLALIAKLPGLLALDMTPTEAWPSLDNLDPFTCNLVFSAILSGSFDEASAVLRLVSDQVRIVALAEPEHLVSPIALAPDAIAVLEEQRRLAATGRDTERSGRFGSARRVAANVLRHAGRIDDALTIEMASDAPTFSAVLERLLRPAAVPIPVTREPEPRDTSARALRVDVERIDTLVKLTGELTVAKNAVGHAVRLAESTTDARLVAEALRNQHALLDRLVGELQRSVLSIRVLPLRHVFQRFPRLVREMAQSLGKSVRLVMEGETTEADKTVVEVLFEPLLHVLRNALDHGIEDPRIREAAGKTATATIRLLAARDGERVIVEVTDDGGGVDVARVRTVAAERRIVPDEILTAMREEEVVNLIFEPGFSTARTVTDLSGRGVGMDAVRAGVARIGGQVGVRSRPGQGTTVRFSLPFTVMMSQVMTVEAGDQVFGIPFDAVVETLRLPRDHIARVGAAQAFVLRDRTVPLVRLTEALELSSPTGCQALEANIVVTRVDGQLGALEVDGFGERLDVMLKPMPGLLAGMAGVAGTTLLGDGRVLLVLDLPDLLQ